MIYMNKSVIDVKDDGNCFYRAIYGYAYLHNMLDSPIMRNFDCYQNMTQDDIQKLTDSFLQRKRYKTQPEIYKDILKKYDNSREDLWVQCMRNYIASQIRIIDERNAGNKLVSIYKSFIECDEETYIAILDAMPGWMKEVFPTKPSSFDDFKNEYANHIEKDCTWVAETEIRIFRHIFDKLGFKLQILSYNNNECIDDMDKVISDSPSQPQSDTFYLVCCNEIHYNFILYNSESVSRGMVVGGKIFIDGKLYKKHTDKNKRVYIKKNRTRKSLKLNF